MKNYFVTSFSKNRLTNIIPVKLKILKKRLILHNSHILIIHSPKTHLNLVVEIFMKCQSRAQGSSDWNLISKKNKSKKKYVEP